MYETRIIDEYFAAKMVPCLCRFDGFILNLWPEYLLYNFVMYNYVFVIQGLAFHPSMNYDTKLEKNTHAFQIYMQRMLLTSTLCLLSLA